MKKKILILVLVVLVLLISLSFIFIFSRNLVTKDSKKAFVAGSTVNLILDADNKNTYSKDDIAKCIPESIQIVSMKKLFNYYYVVLNTGDTIGSFNIGLPGGDSVTIVTIPPELATIKHKLVK